MTARPGWREVRFDVPEAVWETARGLAEQDGTTVTEVCRRLVLGAMRAEGQSREAIAGQRQRFLMALEAVILTVDVSPLAARSIARRALRLD